MTAAASASSGRASERRSRAFLRLLANMCRQFPDLRTWLLEDFGQDAKTRANFFALVERGDLTGEPESDGFAELAGELDGWREEKRRMKAQLPAQATRPFGGLTWDEMEALVRRYEARTIGLNVFLLARDWRKAGEAAKASPRLLQAGADLLDTAKLVDSPISAMPPSYLPASIPAACARRSVTRTGGNCTRLSTCCGILAKPIAHAKCGRISKRWACGSVPSIFVVSANATASAVTNARAVLAFTLTRELPAKRGLGPDSTPDRHGGVRGRACRCKASQGTMREAPATPTEPRRDQT